MQLRIVHNEENKQIRSSLNFSDPIIAPLSWQRKPFKRVETIEAKINETWKISISTCVRSVIIIFYEDRGDKKKWAKRSTCVLGCLDFGPIDILPEAVTNLFKV